MAIFTVHFNSLTPAGEKHMLVARKSEKCVTAFLIYFLFENILFLVAAKLSI
jgi:hypothetical protein